jgi:hypothetical protein
MNLITGRMFDSSGRLEPYEKRTRKRSRSLSDRSGPALASLFTGSVPYGIDRFFARVLCVPYFVVNRSFYLVNLAFGFKVLVAGDVPRNFLSLANNFIRCAFHVFFVHKAPLPW